MPVVPFWYSSNNTMKNHLPVRTMVLLEKYGKGKNRLDFLAIHTTTLASSPVALECKEAGVI